jgi:carbonic anhydrase/acetyltransferase-like protein (isoleucine patch superfamily)
MSKGPSAILPAAVASAPKISASAAIVGRAYLGDGALILQGAVIRSAEGAVRIDTGSAVLENSVAVGTPTMPTTVGRRSTFGHRCLVIGAQVGDLCEIGNASILMPTATLGNRVFLGEGTIVPAGMSLPDDVVVVGRPARIIRAVNEADVERLSVLRGGDLTLPTSTSIPVDTVQEAIPMGQLYDYRGVVPTIADSAVLFPTAEVTGDVVIGERTIIGAGVKIIGDSHGPVRIGNEVQILENTVLHLLPDNELILEDGVIIGPGAMIHGCHIGAESIVEPGAIVCDHSIVGAGSIVRAGAVVKQRSTFEAPTEIDGFPAKRVGPVAQRAATPAWAFTPGELPTPASAGGSPGSSPPPL